MMLDEMGFSISVGAGVSDLLYAVLQHVSMLFLQTTEDVLKSSVAV